MIGVTEKAVEKTRWGEIMGVMLDTVGKLIAGYQGVSGPSRSGTVCLSETGPARRRVGKANWQKTPEIA